MAEKLVRYYKHVGDAAGLPGKIQLAQLTKVPSTRAAMTPDTPDVIELFRNAIAQITGTKPPLL
jgi:hypothetical protein